MLIGPWVKVGICGLRSDFDLIFCGFPLDKTAGEHNNFGYSILTSA